jgi:hypothetical protein
MRLTTFLLLLALLGLFVTVAPAADVTGKWVAQVPGRGGNTQETTFNLKANGSNLTGTVVTPRGETPIAEGKISGDDISFAQNLEFGGNSVKIVYKGKVSGNEIKFTRQREGGQAPPQEFTAKKAS